jgi:hypothetical protein
MVGQTLSDQAQPGFRSPDDVMRLDRMGCAHPTRLSFLRVLLRRLRDEGWRFDRPVWQIDARGVGRAVYRARGPERTYSLVAFAHDLPDHMRSDRVIATAWDATFTLFDGEPDAANLDRLAANVPLQEAGRISGRELTLARANRSVRLFTHVVDCLSAGRQPEAAALDEVGYLMRTTAVYGSGKFGAAARDDLASRDEMRGPFQAEMLTVWLIRAFTVDLVNHLAAVRGGARAARLAPALCRRLGVGNSTGLGMAPFLIRHPMLLNNWMAARETALARVRALPNAAPGAVAGLLAAHAAAADNAQTWHSAHPRQVQRLAELRADLDRIGGYLTDWPGTDRAPWDKLWRWGAASLTTEGQEALLAILLEPHGALIDDLADTMDADEGAAFRIDGRVTVSHRRRQMARDYGWTVPGADDARFWYVSEEKLEPRLGRRHEEPGAERELPIDTARRAAAMMADLGAWTGADRMADFLLAHPEHRFMARRAQLAETHPYAEIRDNLIAADMLPIDLLRCKLAFFGASHFDPRSDLWVRIALFQGAPYPDDLAAGGAP